MWNRGGDSVAGATLTVGVLLLPDRGSEAQSVLLILGRHEPGLYVLAGFLVAFGAFGVMLHVTAGPRGPGAAVPYATVR